MEDTGDVGAVTKTGTGTESNNPRPTSPGYPTGKYKHGGTGVKGLSPRTVLAGSRTKRVRLGYPEQGIIPGNISSYSGTVYASFSV